MTTPGSPEPTREDPVRGGGDSPPREGAWGAVGVGLLLGLFVLAVLATLHSLIVTFG